MKCLQSCFEIKVDSSSTCTQRPLLSASCCENFSSVNILQPCLSDFFSVPAYGYKLDIFLCNPFNTKMRCCIICGSRSIANVTVALTCDKLSEMPFIRPRGNNPIEKLTLFFLSIGKSVSHVVCKSASKGVSE